jgi:uncharacterized coiled-coil DUF342 family protein
LRFELTGIRCAREIFVATGNFRDQRTEIRDQRTEIRDQGSGIRDQRSEIRDQRSGIREQRSGIREQEGGEIRFLALNLCQRNWVMQL